MAYAERTSVPVDRTKAEIESTLRRYGADRFAYFSEAGRAIVVFEVNGRRIKFVLPISEGVKPADDQQRRSRWRALLLTIKAKLESVHSKIETFEEAFLAHIVLPDGKTVSEHAVPAVKAIWTNKRMTPLLPGPGSW